MSDYNYGYPDIIGEEYGGVGRSTSDMIGGGEEDYNLVAGEQMLVGGVPVCKRALARIVEKNAVLLKTREYANAKRFLLPFSVVTDLAAGATATLTTSPQLVCKPKRIVFDSSFASLLTVSQIVIGQRNQMVSQNGEVLAGIFSEVSQDTYLDLDTAAVSSEVSITVRNISPNVIPIVTCGWICTALT